jgi:hypothetical protein
MIQIIETEAAWIAPLSLLSAPSVIVGLNPGSRVQSWVCEHVAPQPSTKENQLFACPVCSVMLKTGADIVIDE